MRKLLVAGALTAGLALSASAHADIMQLTFTGVIGDGPENAAALFGLTDQSILGKDFTYTMTYDTALGHVGSLPPFDGPALIGAAAPGPDMILGATLAVDQQTMSPTIPTAGAAAVIFAATPGGAGEICGAFETDATHDSFLNACAVVESPLPSSFTAPLGQTPILVNQAAFVQLHLEDTPQGTLRLTGDVTSVAIARLGASPGGVPEPAAWALMLTGFFAAGAGLRMRRRALAA